MALDTKMQISVYSSPLQINYLMLNDVDLNPPLAILEPAALVTLSYPYTNVIYEYVIDDIYISKLFLVQF